MAKKSAKTTRRKRTAPARRAGAASRAGSGRKTAAKSRKGKTGRKRSSGSSRPIGQSGAKRARSSRAGSSAAPSRRAAPARKPGAKATKKKGARPAGGAARRGGSGQERTLAQTPAAGRSRRGPTNPMPTKRSTGTPGGAGSTRSPAIDRERRRLREYEEGVPTPPSSLDMDRLPSAARSGRRHLQDAREEHHETSPVLTGGDVDADWEDAYAVGDEAPGGDNPTPDQDRVEDIGRALGVTYEDNEELKASDKIADRDRHRWELDPASSEDYRERNE